MGVIIDISLSCTPSPCIIYYGGSLILYLSQSVPHFSMSSTCSDLWPEELTHLHSIIPASHLVMPLSPVGSISFCYRQEQNKGLVKCGHPGVIWCFSNHQRSRLLHYVLWPCGFCSWVTRFKMATAISAVTSASHLAGRMVGRGRSHSLLKGPSQNCTHKPSCCIAQNLVP